MFCKKCGADIPDKSVVCPYCRFDLSTPMPQTLRTPAYREGYSGGDAAPPVYEQPVYQEPVYEQPQYQEPVYQQPQYQQPPHQYIQPVPQPVAPDFVTPQQQAEANSVLIWGILGLAFACTFWLSFLGIIFSAIDRGKVKDYLYRYGVLYGKAKVGNILSRIGLPVGIVLTAFAVIYVIYAIVIAGAAVAYYY